MIRQSPKTRTHRNRNIVGLCLALALASGGATAIAGAHSDPQGVRHSDQSRFAVFSRRGHRARSASTTNIPVNAVLAGTSNADGQSNEVYAWERAPGEYCLLDVEHVTARTVLCGGRAGAEEHGLMLSEKSDEYAGINMVGLVPNGVNTVTFTDSDGTAHAIKVSNNFVDYANAGGVTSARFTLPNGRVEETQSFRR